MRGGLTLHRTEQLKLSPVRTRGIGASPAAKRKGMSLLAIPQAFKSEVGLDGREEVVAPALSGVSCTKKQAPSTVEPANFPDTSCASDVALARDDALL
jgi:hypothetical protein